VNKLSILQNFRASDVTREPFPHFVIDRALPDALYDELSRAYPAIDTIFAHSFRKKEKEMAQNARYDLSSAEVLDMPDLPVGPWRDFVQYHTSQEFLDEVLDKLGDVIGEAYPDLISAMTRKAPDGRPRAGVRRHSDKAEACELALDCQIGINSPVTVEGTSVIGPHLDNPKELYAGLFYMRHPDDRAAGGDLVAYAWKDRTKARFHAKRYIDPSLVEERGVTPYGPNRFFWFLNGQDSVHGVTVRERSQAPRRLVNIIAEVYPTVPKLFGVEAMQPRNSVFRRIGKLLGV
jgi:hypothetical protein